MKTRITELLGIRYPIVQGGMAWVAEYHLAAAVSNAGGLGIIGAASAPPEVVRTQIQEAKRLTDQPFGVNVMLMNPNASEVAQVIIEEGVPVVTTGAGNPGKFIPDWKEAGIKVIPVVASVAMAKMMERAGADAVVAEGMEAGGHIGEQTTMVLVPQVADAVQIPVIAAGGMKIERTSISPTVCSIFKLSLFMTTAPSYFTNSPYVSCFVPLTYPFAASTASESER